MNGHTIDLAMTEIDWGPFSCTDVFNWSEQSECPVLGQVCAQVKETLFVSYKIRNTFMNAVI
jgi:hypothetical protein